MLQWRDFARNLLSNCFGSMDIKYFDIYPERCLHNTLYFTFLFQRRWIEKLPRYGVLAPSHHTLYGFELRVCQRDHVWTGLHFWRRSEKAHLPQVRRKRPRGSKNSSVRHTFVLWSGQKRHTSTICAGRKRRSKHAHGSKSLSVTTAMTARFVSRLQNICRLNQWMVTIVQHHYCPTD